MRNSTRIIALLLCAVLLGTCVFAAEPSAPASETLPAETELTVLEETNPSAGADLPDAEPLPAEPAATEPAVTEPVVTEPVVTEPVVTEPVVTEPVVTEPVVTEPTEPEPTDPPEPPEPPEPPVSEMTDEQIIAKFHIKNTWSRNALIFAVRNGILAGKGGDDLAPTDNTSTTELAVMLTNLLGSEKEASLSRFTDLLPSAWYRLYLAKAVSLGIYPIDNPNATKLRPNDFVTREEAFVAIARVFGIHGRGRQAIYRFSDWKDVSDWAAEDIAALIDNNCIAGSEGKIHPKDRISREEFAAVLSQLITKVTRTLDSSSFTGKLCLRGTNVPANTTIKGSMIISSDEPEITLTGLTVTDRLVVHGNGRVIIHLNGCSINHLVLCREAYVYSDTTLKQVTNYQFMRVYCNITTLNAYDGLTVYSPFTVNTLNVQKQLNMTVNGTVKNLNVYGDSVYVNGTGKIENVLVRGKNFTNRCATDKTSSNPFPTLAGATVTRTDSGVVNSSNVNYTMGLKLANMPEGYGEYDLIWYVDGKEASATTRTLLKTGSTISAKYNLNQYLQGFDSYVPFTCYIRLTGGSWQLLYKGNINVAEEVFKTAAQNIRTQNVQGTLRNKGTLYNSMALSTKIGNLSAGTQVTILQSRQQTATKIRLPDGTVGWTDFYNVAVINAKYYITTDYAPKVKEYYVNHIRNCTSGTKYLIWVSLYTQRINIFQGSKGNWKLIRSGPIASGVNYCPTPAEVVQVWGRTNQWLYENFYCHHVTYFDEARAFHSRPTAYGGGIYNPAIGYPASAGCIRLMDEDCIWVHTNCANGTAVYIY